MSPLPRRLQPLVAICRRALLYITNNQQEGLAPKRCICFQGIFSFFSNLIYSNGSPQRKRKMVARPIVCPRLEAEFIRRLTLDPFGEHAQNKDVAPHTEVPPHPMKGCLLAGRSFCFRAWSADFPVRGSQICVHVSELRRLTKNGVITRHKW